MGELLNQFSQALVETVKAAQGSVVRVEGRSRLPASGIVWSADGLIVTAGHVLERDKVRVGLPEGEAAPAKLLGRDPGVDVALLRVEAGGLKPADWAEPERMQVGAPVLALGRPGEKIMATFGVVSALDQGWRTPQGAWMDHYLQTDVVMFPGFSGGPLVNADARVVGLTSSGLVNGLSLAVTAPTLRGTVAQLLAHGRVRRGYLGVGAQPVPLADGLREAAGQEAGLLLLSVEPDGPAGRSGLMLGDTLLTLNGRPVRSLEALLATLSDDLVGKKVPAQVVRGGHLQAMDVLIGER